MRFSKGSRVNYWMSWNVEVKPTAEKYYLRLDKRTRVRIRKALENLEASDEPGPSLNVRALTGKLLGDYRLRVGKWRILFQLDREKKIMSMPFCHVAMYTEQYDKKLDRSDTKQLPSPIYLNDERRNAECRDIASDCENADAFRQIQRSPAHRPARTLSGMACKSRFSPGKHRQDAEHCL